MLYFQVAAWWLAGTNDFEGESQCSGSNPQKVFGAALTSSHALAINLMLILSIDSGRAGAAEQRSARSPPEAYQPHGVRVLLGCLGRRRGAGCPRATASGASP